MTTVRGGICALLLLAASAVTVGGQVAPDVRPPALDGPRVGLMDSVAKVMRRMWPDGGERAALIPMVLNEFGGAADSAVTFRDEVAVVRRMLARIPKSHLGLTTATASRSVTRGYRGEREATFGVQLMHWNGRYYATAVLDGGPAARAGIRPWDEIVSIDGEPPSRSARLDWSTDDASLDDSRDPPVHPLHVHDRPTAVFRLRQTMRDTIERRVTATSYSAWDATEYSLRVMEIEGGVRIGVVHLWYMFSTEISWFARRFDAEWNDIDALVLDVRGRGGFPLFGDAVAAALNPGRAQRFRGPLVVLQDRQTRSAKEALLYRLSAREATRFVGEPSAGAVLPSSAVPVGFGLVLSLPGNELRDYPGLEGYPREPTDVVRWGGPLAPGDPIFEAGLRTVLELVDRHGRGQVLPKAPPEVIPAIDNTLKSKIPSRPTTRRP